MRLAVAVFGLPNDFLLKKLQKLTPNSTQGGQQISAIFPFWAPIVTKVSTYTENMLPELQKSPFCTPKGIQMTPIVKNFMQNASRKRVPHV